MMVRGLDYLTGDSPDTARRLSTMEAAAPLQVWGLLFVVGALAGFVSMLVRRSTGVLWSHLIGALGYWALAAGLAADVVERSQAQDGNLWTLGIVCSAGLAGGIVKARQAVEGRYMPVIVLTFALATVVGFLAIPFDGLRNATVFICIAMLHVLMAAGTAGQIRQARIR